MYLTDDPLSRTLLMAEIHHGKFHFFCPHITPSKRRVVDPHGTGVRARLVGGNQTYHVLTTLSAEPVADDLSRCVSL